MDLNQMLETYCLPRPTALKIDTDGGEYAILSMFMNNPTVVKTIYLEDNKDDEAALCQELLISRGYSIVSQNDQNPEDQTPFSGSRQTIYSK
jgi:hypothetical protein